MVIVLQKKCNVLFCKPCWLAVRNWRVICMGIANMPARISAHNNNDERVLTMHHSARLVSAALLRSPLSCSS